MVVARSPYIEATVFGVVAYFIANKEEIQADYFNLEGHAHNVLGQKRRSAGGLFASRFHNQRRCLLQHTSKIAPHDPE